MDKTQLARLLAAVTLLSGSLGLTFADEASAGAPSTAEPKTGRPVDQYTRKKLPGRMKSGTLTVTRSASAGSSSKTNGAVRQYTRRKLPGRMKSGTLSAAPTGGGTPPDPK